MQINDSISIRDLLWEWAYVYRERPGDSVGYPCKSAFQLLTPVHSVEAADVQRAELTDSVVREWLQIMQARSNSEAVRTELEVFWARYYECRDVRSAAKKLGLTRTKICEYCSRIEASIEVLFQLRAKAA
ncbi:hypothetical protein OQJ68_10655 [Microbulbifer thermotolerans]|uniref:Phage antitermination protein Q n=1 Tax=Microbulbifer thermotolerans TaxID=252514 RepID=A0AB35HYB7_MICTH|nr:hypothetical protein [Microbulbifer thermotolerans]MCX2802245.1 hypothetical protein [Microbulbifer thermotolerans]